MLRYNFHLNIVNVAVICLVNYARQNTRWVIIAAPCAILHIFFFFGKILRVKCFKFNNIWVSDSLEHTQISPDWLRRSRIYNTVPLWLQQVGVLWGYCAATACTVAPVTVTSVCHQSTLNGTHIWSSYSGNVQPVKEYGCVRCNSVNTSEIKKKKKDEEEEEKRSKN